MTHLLHFCGWLQQTRAGRSLLLHVVMHLLLCCPRRWMQGLRWLCCMQVLPVLPLQCCLQQLAASVRASRQPSAFMGKGCQWQKVDFQGSHALTQLGPHQLHCFAEGAPLVDHQTCRQIALLWWCIDPFDLQADTPPDSNQCCKQCTTGTMSNSEAIFESLTYRSRSFTSMPFTSLPTGHQEGGSTTHRHRDSAATMTCSSPCNGCTSASACSCCLFASASLNSCSSSSSLLALAAKGAWDLLGRPLGDPAQLDCLPWSHVLPSSSSTLLTSC